MIILLEMPGSADVGANHVALAATILVVGVFMWRFILACSRAPKHADPWDEKVAAALKRDDAVPLCTHCLAQHSRDDEFCPNCGGPVGPYTNSLPFPYIFSLGHVLRIGTQEKFKRSPILILGFVLVAFVEYFIFAPVYWFMLLKNVFRQQDIHPSEDTGQTDA